MLNNPEYFVHPNALAESANIGRGTRIWAFAHVLPGARIGENCNISDHVFIESHAVIGNQVTIKNGVSVWDQIVLEDRVFVGPNAVFTNDKNPRVAYKKHPAEFLPTIVREGATIGANVTVICNIEIGRHAFIGAGAVVTRSVPDYGVIVGNPGHLVGYMCECGEKIHPDVACVCGRMYTNVNGTVICAPEFQLTGTQYSASSIVQDFIVDPLTA